MKKTFMGTVRAFSRSLFVAPFSFARMFAAGIVTSVTCSSVWADPTLLAEAQKQIAAGNPKAAYMLLVKEQDTLAGTESFDYLLGVAALDSGKIDEAIIAFERVLAVNRNNAGAELDLGRAYFVAGSLDLAESTFQKLKASKPPAPALAAIDRYLAAIEQKRVASRRSFGTWGETSLGYDTNLTGVPKDFSGAVEQAFNIQGVAPTGNSIKRAAPYLAAGVGFDLLQPFNARWSGYVGGELRGRAYRKQPVFNSESADARAALQWDTGEHLLRLNAGYGAYVQQGDTPQTATSPKITNNRRSSIVGTEYRAALPAQSQLSVGLVSAQTRFATNPTEDFDSSIVQLGLTKQIARPSSPLIQLTTFHSRDNAKRLLADGITDKSKKITGVRVFTQINWTETFSPFLTIGGLQRRDDKPFARATEVANGRDKLVDIGLGVNWRFQEKCGMRAQWTGARNDSNIALYDYTRHEVSSNIRCDF